MFFVNTPVLFSSEKNRFFEMATNDVHGNNNYVVPNLDRACSVLEYLAEKSKPCSLTEISRSLGLPKNSAFRILFTLQRRDFVRLEDSGYCLSSKLLALGHTVIDGSTLLEKAMPILRDLRDSTHETVGFAVMSSDYQGVVLEQVPSPEPVKILIAIGHRFPLHSAAPGKILVAYQPNGIQRKIIQTIDYCKYTENTILTSEAYEKELANVRLLGYALDRMEGIDHIVCVAAPVFDHKGKIAASVWITAPLFRLSIDTAKHKASDVMKAGLEISQRLGYGENF